MLAIPRPVESSSIMVRSSPNLVAKKGKILEETAGELQILGRVGAFTLASVLQQQVASTQVLVNRVTMTSQQAACLLTIPAFSENMGTHA